MDVATVLNAAADLIEPEGAWTQEHLAKNAEGEWRDSEDSDAACWCVVGAISKTVVETQGFYGCLYLDAREALAKALGTDRDGGLPDWNDAPERTQAEVVAALRQAALSHRPKEATDD